jgi:hypothetical protein
MKFYASSALFFIGTKKNQKIPKFLKLNNCDSYSNCTILKRRFTCKDVVEGLLKLFELTELWTSLDKSKLSFRSVTLALTLLLYLLLLEEDFTLSSQLEIS